MNLTPKQVLEFLNLYVVGQPEAKRILSIAMRDRYRLLNVKDEDLRSNIKRKNILFSGPTGCGKTELVSSICNKFDIPFAKCDATRFTEVGYVGKDVESSIHDLIEHSINIQKNLAEKSLDSKTKEEECLNIVLKAILKKNNTPANEESILQCKNEFEEGKFDNIIIEVKIEKPASENEQIDLHVDPNSHNGNHAIGFVNLQDMLKTFSGTNSHKVYRLKPKEMLKKLINTKSLFNAGSNLIKNALEDAQSRGIVFIDEIDKIISNKKNTSSRGDISREGVQRDLLPIVEGTIIKTKYGSFNTKNVLFIGAGSFYSSKISDLMPEIQGRFPIRAQLSALTMEDFIKILTVPMYNPIRQCKALLETDYINLDFTEGGIQAIAEYAVKMNIFFENTGARRLYGVIERIIIDLSFEVRTEDDPLTVSIDKKYVDEKMKNILNATDNKVENHII
ncbi:ATP-dependent protease ATPase subunit HslU [Rickettsiales bacterium]|nr:ATP-dependent protease ATPase subunit HslU [Rickettsiales bacterium]